MATPHLPATVRWARRLCLFYGVLLGLVALAAAVLLLAPPGVRRGPGLHPGVLLLTSASSSAGLLVAALGLRARSRWAWRSGVAALVMLLLVDVLAPAGGRRFGASSIISAIALWTLLARSSRKWIATTDAELEAAHAEERSVRLARRRLTPEAPSLRDISFKDLPLRDRE